jgi:hypothetical protein
MIAKEDFPEKYHKLLEHAKIEKSLCAEISVLFKDFPSFYEFLRIFRKEDFPSDKFPDGVGLGIFARCPACGRLLIADMPFNLVQLNSQTVKRAYERKKEVISVCLSCLIKSIGPANMGEYCEETKRSLRLIESGPGEDDAIN